MNPKERRETDALVATIHDDQLVNNTEWHIMGSEERDTKFCMDFYLPLHLLWLSPWQPLHVAYVEFTSMRSWLTTVSILGS